MVYELFLNSHLWFRTELTVKLWDCIKCIGAVTWAELWLKSLFFRSKVGVLEFRNLSLHSLCRYSQKSWCPHFKSEVCKPGYLDAWTSCSKLSCSCLRWGIVIYQGSIFHVCFILHCRVFSRWEIVVLELYMKRIFQITLGDHRQTRH